MVPSIWRQLLKVPNFLAWKNKYMHSYLISNWKNLPIQPLQKKMKNLWSPWLAHCFLTICILKFLISLVFSQSTSFIFKTLIIQCLPAPVKRLIIFTSRDRKTSLISSYWFERGISPRTELRVLWFPLWYLARASRESQASQESAGEATTLEFLNKPPATMWYLGI